METTNSLSDIRTRDTYGRHDGCNLTHIRESSSADVFINGYKQKELSIVPNEKHTTHVTLRTGNNLVSFETSKDSPPIRYPSSHPNSLMSSTDWITSLSPDLSSMPPGAPAFLIKLTKPKINNTMETSLDPIGLPLPWRPSAPVVELSRFATVKPSHSISGDTLSSPSVIDHKCSTLLRQQSNGVVVRFSIPDSSNGGGQTASIQLVSDAATANLTLTSKFSWTYGEYPYSNDPSKKKAHHFFDEVRYLFPTSLPAGSKVRRAQIFVPIPQHHPGQAHLHVDISYHCRLARISSSPTTLR